MLQKLQQIKTITKDMNILYVEDDDSLRDVTIPIFRQIFDNLLTASDGREGLEIYKSHMDKNKIQLIISDIEMPHMSGIEMIKEIKLIDSVIPIVFLTAYSQNEYFISSIDLSIDGYILKPLNIEEFINVILRISEKYFLNNETELSYNFMWNNKSKELKKENETIKLTKNEKQLLDILISQKSLVSQDSLENLIFPDLEYNNKRIRNLVSRLNLKLGDAIIESVYASGYKIKLDK